MSHLLIDLSKDCDEGGYCSVASIIDNKDIVFKQFCSKNKAQEALKYQKILAKYDLAPKIYSEICKLRYSNFNGLSLIDKKSSWGYVTERAMKVSHSKKNMILVQNLVDDIRYAVKLKFWDCHWYNVGFIKRGKFKKLVCIDTGKESFDGYSNAWGNPDPGPLCSYCNTYKCNCEE